MSRHLLNPPVYVAILAITLLAPSSVCSAKPDTGSYTSSGATQQSTVTRTKKTDAESGFSWTDVQNGTLHGVEIDGKTIIPCKFTSIYYFLGRFSANIAGSPNQAACYKPDGTVLIDLKYGYEGFSMMEDSPYCSVIKKGYTGLYNLDRKEEIISPSKGYTSIEYWSVKDNQVVVAKGDSKGLFDISKAKEIVPTTMGYTSISLWSLDDGQLYVEKGGLQGVYDVLAGREIISPNRGYDSALMGKEDGKRYYYVKKEEKEGVCIATGEEIIPPIYASALYSGSREQFIVKTDDGEYHDTGFDLEGKRITAERPYYPRSSSSSTSSGVTSSTSSSSSSLSSSSSSYSASSSSGLTSDYGSLLFEGVFTFTGQTIQNLQIVNTGVTFTTSFTIYENVLIPKGDGIARYVGNEDFFTVDCRKYVTEDNPDTFYYVNRVGVVYLGMRTTESYPFVGTITSVGYMILEPGDTRSQHSAVPQSGYNNGYSNGGDKASKEQMYRNQYAQWEKTVISHWNSLTSMRDGAARTSMRMNFRNAQSQMRQVRQNAQMEGISIMASAWETASVPLGYE